jgi:hypothetical protein
MSFGKRGVVPYSTVAPSGAVANEYFTESSPKRPNFFTLPKILWVAEGKKGSALGEIAYPLACLIIGILLGGGIGATLVPQLLHAENAGVYEFLHMNDTMMRARQPAPSAAAPRVRLPQVSFHRQRGRASVMQARLSPAQLQPEHRRFRHLDRTVTSLEPGPEIGPHSSECRNCELARYGSPIEAILHDTTLRAGDTVMMRFGAMVFKGAEHVPYTQADFTDFRKSTLLTNKERKLIDDDLGLSRRAELMRSFISQARAAKPAELAKATGVHLSATP